MSETRKVTAFLPAKLLADAQVIAGAGAADTSSLVIFLARKTPRTVISYAERCAPPGREPFRCEPQAPA